MKAIVDQDACISCGLCPEVCPEVYRMNADDKAEAYVDPVPDAVLAKAQDAAEQCPVEAIIVE
jgi:ferredoxin